jgi:hypothetical protein
MLQGHFEVQEIIVCQFVGRRRHLNYLYRLKIDFLRVSWLEKLPLTAALPPGCKVIRANVSKILEQLRVLTVNRIFAMTDIPLVAAQELPPIEVDIVPPTIRCRPGGVLVE